jgi:hypothetical protein
MKSLALFIGFLFLVPSVFAADSTTVRKRFLVAGLNAVAYKGSLQSSYTRWTPAYQIALKFEKKKIINGMVSLTFGQVIGEDRTYTLPSKAVQTLAPVSKFQTQFFALHYEAQLMLFKYHGLRIYASQGIGLFKFTVKDWDGNNLSGKDKTRSKGETYSETSTTFPTQVGLTYRFQNDMQLGFQAGVLNPVTAYLDNMKELSNNDNSDNIAAFRFQFYYPLR